jgi:hypothetical protein
LWEWYCHIPSVKPIVPETTAFAAVRYEAQAADKALAAVPRINLPLVTSATAVKGM